MVVYLLKPRYLVIKLGITIIWIKLKNVKTTKDLTRMYLALFEPNTEKLFYF